MIRALICEEPGRLAIHTLPEPEKSPNNVRIKISTIGICGTDYHLYKGNQPMVSYPRTMGHELSGYAIDDSDDGRINTGDLVTINPYLNCGSCRACSSGKPNCCETLAVLGVHTEGGMCEVISVPEQNVVPVPDLTESSAAMVEFLAIGAHGVYRAAIEPEYQVLVIGAGPIGVGAALFAKLDGAEVTLRDVSADRLALAAKILPNVRLESIDALEDRAYDIVIDATGSLKAMNDGLNWLAHGGNYVLLSIVNGSLEIPDLDFHKREATLLASRNALMSDFDRVIAAIRAGNVPTDAMATHRTTLEDAVTDLPVWADDRGEVLKALIYVG